LSKRRQVSSKKRIARQLKKERGEREDIKMAKLTPEQLAPKLRDMAKADILSTLSTYTATEIKQIAKLAGVKIPKSETKGRSIQLMANHYGFIQLDAQIAQRPSSAIEPLLYTHR